MNCGRFHGRKIILLSLKSSRAGRGILFLARPGVTVSSYVQIVWVEAVFEQKKGCEATNDVREFTRFIFRDVAPQDALFPAAEPFLKHEIAPDSIVPHRPWNIRPIHVFAEMNIKRSCASRCSYRFA